MPQRRRTATVWVLRAVVAVAILAVVGVVGYRLLPVSISLASPSYAFDVTDREQVAGFADHVVVVTVTEIGASRSSGPPGTSFSAMVEESLKGGFAGPIVFTQTGVDYHGKQQVRISGVEVLTVGHTYVLALRGSTADGLGLVSGPHSPEHVAGPDGSVAGDPVAVWRDAVAHQRWPDDLPR